MNKLYIDDPAKWKTRILRQIHTYSWSSRCVPIWHNILVFHFVSSSTLIYDIYDVHCTYVYCTCVYWTCLKGTVSRELRWVLLYINRKLFSRAIVGRHKILILLKGHFTINKRRSSLWTALQFLMVCKILDPEVLCTHNSRWRHYLQG